MQRFLALLVPQGLNKRVSTLPSVDPSFKGMAIIWPMMEGALDAGCSGDPHSMFHFTTISRHMYPKVLSRKICCGSHSKIMSRYCLKWMVLISFRKIATLIWNTPMITANFILKELK